MLRGMAVATIRTYGDSAGRIDVYCDICHQGLSQRIGVDQFSSWSSGLARARFESQIDEQFDRRIDRHRTRCGVLAYMLCPDQQKKGTAPVLTPTEVTLGFGV